MSQPPEAKQQTTNNVNQFNRFLNNNSDFLTQKYNQHYVHPFPIEELTNPSYTEKSLRFIYDIFSFSKYESDPKLNNTLRKSLAVNIASFTSNQLKSSNKDHIFTNERAVELLKYCIENNDMFAVHYDKKNPPKKKRTQEIEYEKPKQQEQNVQIQQSRAQSQVKQEEQQNHNEETEEIQKETVEQNSQKQPDQMTCSNQFAKHSQAEIIKKDNNQLIKKQLKAVFQFYCKQQQNIGPQFTFDNINHKCQTMNLGKFIAFAIAAGIAYERQKAYSQAKIEKRTLINIFKKVAEGDRQISFTQFMNMMEQLKKIDQNVFDKMGLGQQGAKGRNKLLQKLKYFNLPFSTRDPQGREILPPSKTFANKLTTHSGMDESSLRQQLLSRKQRSKLYPSAQKYKIQSKLAFSRKNQTSQLGNIVEEQDANKYTLKLGKSADNSSDAEDMHFLSKLISQQQNDDIFLKDYQLPSRKNINSHKQKISIKSFDEGGRYTKQQLERGLEKHFGKNQGGFTTRVGPKEQLILPLIKRPKDLNNNTQRRSLGTHKKLGNKIFNNI